MTTTTQTMPANVARVAAAGRAWATDLRLGGSLLTIAGVTILMGIIIWVIAFGGYLSGRADGDRTAAAK